MLSTIMYCSKQYVKTERRKLRMNNNTTIYRATMLLRDAIKLTISLKATKNSNPLQMVVLDNLEAQLKEAESFLDEERQRTLLNEAKCWDLLDIIFKKICKVLFKVTNTLLCKLFLLQQKLNIYYEIRKCSKIGTWY